MRKAASKSNFFSTAQRNTMTQDNGIANGLVLASSSSSSNQESDLRKGPNIPWTIADLFANPRALAVFYQSIGTSYDIGTPLGTAVAGLVVHPLFLSSASWIQTAANGGLACGFGGMAFGAARFVALASAASSAEMQLRRDQVVCNNEVRALDAGTYTGLVVGGLAMAIAGGPASLGLAPGFLGARQGLSLGAAGGSLLTMTYIVALRQQQR